MKSRQVARRRSDQHCLDRPARGPPQGLDACQLLSTYLNSLILLQETSITCVATFNVLSRQSIQGSCGHTTNISGEGVLQRAGRAARSPWHRNEPLRFSQYCCSSQGAGSAVHSSTSGEDGTAVGGSSSPTAGQRDRRGETHGQSSSGASVCRWDQRLTRECFPGASVKLQGGAGGRAPPSPFNLGREAPDLPEAEQL